MNKHKIKKSHYVYYYGIVEHNGDFVSVYTARPKRNDGYCMKIPFYAVQRSLLF